MKGAPQKPKVPSQPAGGGATQTWNYTEDSLMCRDKTSTETTEKRVAGGDGKGAQQQQQQQQHGTPWRSASTGRSRRESSSPPTDRVALPGEPAGAPWRQRSQSEDRRPRLPPAAKNVEEVAWKHGPQLLKKKPKNRAQLAESQATDKPVPWKSAADGLKKSSQQRPSLIDSVPPIAAKSDDVPWKAGMQNLKKKPSREPSPAGSESARSKFRKTVSREVSPDKVFQSPATATTLATPAEESTGDVATSKQEPKEGPQVGGFLPKNRTPKPLVIEEPAPEVMLKRTPQRPKASEPEPSPINLKKIPLRTKPAAPVPEPVSLKPIPPKEKPKPPDVEEDVVDMKYIPSPIPSRPEAAQLKTLSPESPAPTDQSKKTETKIDGAQPQSESMKMDEISTKSTTVHDEEIEIKVKASVIPTKPSPDPTQSQVMREDQTLMTIKNELDETTTSKPISKKKQKPEATLSSKSVDQETAKPEQVNPIPVKQPEDVGPAWRRPKPSAPVTTTVKHTEVDQQVIETTSSDAIQLKPTATTDSVKTESKPEIVDSVPAWRKPKPTTTVTTAVTDTKVNSNVIETIETVKTEFKVEEVAAVADSVPAWRKPKPLTTVVEDTDVKQQVMETPSAKTTQSNPIPTPESVKPESKGEDSVPAWRKPKAPSKKQPEPEEQLPVLQLKKTPQSKRPEQIPPEEINLKPIPKKQVVPEGVQETSPSPLWPRKQSETLEQVPAVQLKKTMPSKRPEEPHPTEDINLKPVPKKVKEPAVPVSSPTPSTIAPVMEITSTESIQLKSTATECEVKETTLPQTPSTPNSISTSNLNFKKDTDFKKPKAVATTENQVPLPAEGETPTPWGTKLKSSARKGTQASIVTEESSAPEQEISTSELILKPAAQTTKTEPSQTPQETTDSTVVVDVPAPLPIQVKSTQRTEAPEDTKISVMEVKRQPEKILEHQSRVELKKTPQCKLPEEIPAENIQLKPVPKKEVIPEDVQEFNNTPSRPRKQPAPEEQLPVVQLKKTPQSKRPDEIPPEEINLKPIPKKQVVPEDVKETSKTPSRPRKQFEPEEQLPVVQLKKTPQSKRPEEIPPEEINLKPIPKKVKELIIPEPTQSPVPDNQPTTVQFKTSPRSDSQEEVSAAEIILKPKESKEILPEPSVVPESVAQPEEEESQTPSTSSTSIQLKPQPEKIPVTEVEEIAPAKIQTTSTKRVHRKQTITKQSSSIEKVEQVAPSTEPASGKQEPLTKKTTMKVETTIVETKTTIADSPEEPEDQQSQSTAVAKIKPRVLKKAALTTLSRYIAPTFKKKLQPLTSRAGKKIRLNCLFEGEPIPTITWYCNEVLIKPDEHWAITTQDDSTILELNNVVLEDSGIYTCRAVNEAGSATTSANVIVTGTNIDLFISSIASR